MSQRAMAVAPRVVHHVRIGYDKDAPPREVNAQAELEVLAVHEEALVEAPQAPVVVCDEEKEHASHPKAWALRYIVARRSHTVKPAP